MTPTHCLDRRCKARPTATHDGDLLSGRQGCHYRLYRPRQFVRIAIHNLRSGVSDVR